MYEYYDITVNDLDEIVSLHKEYLNYGYGIYPHFKKVIEDKETVSCKCVDSETNTIVGIALYTRSIALSGDHEDLCDKIRNMTTGAVVYTGDALLVRQEHRHMRLSYNINELIKTELKARAEKEDKECYVLHELWVYPDGIIPAKKVVEDIYGTCHDFGIIENFYKDFHHHGYLCPICKDTCRCSAKIILSKL